MKKPPISRRKFCKTASIIGLGAGVLPIHSFAFRPIPHDEKPKTNIADASKLPRNKNSMPGKYPAKVVQISDSKSIVGNEIQKNTVNEMISKGMLALTGAKTIKDAWLQFVSPDNRIGLKVNPVAGKQLSTSIEITQVIIEQLVAAGIPKEKIMIWDRREYQLHDAGFTNKNFEGITIRGTEQKDETGSFYDDDGELYSKKMIDKDWYYWADTEQKYKKETLPYMINGGKYSYFSRICTQEVDKIINIPILKNAGSSITLCLKNLAYGAISNTARLHKALWGETSAEVCAFAPLRDKVILNIVDGIKGCYHGGPGANPNFFTQYQTILLGTDPVAVDRIGYDIVIKKRIAEKLQEADSPASQKFMKLAEELKLGIADISTIEHLKI